MSTEIDLVAIVSVERSQRVYCQAPGCRKSIYRRIHVMRTDGEIWFCGSTCYGNLFGQLPHRHPSFGDWGGRILTPIERALLLKNTEGFLNLLKVWLSAATNENFNQPPSGPIPVNNEPVPIAPTPVPAVSTGYGATRNLYCIECGDQFYSLERHCVRCNRSDSVFTWQK